MSELPAVTGRDAILAFSRLGFVEVRIKGSHHILKKPGHPYVLSVPVRGQKALKPGTLRTLIRGAGVSVEAFIECLDR
jgi:predicted RNA binding protein YcfA (HicA-like mRNA interferase family)